MVLKDLIERLEQEDPAKVVPIGFSHPHSYRGYYEELAFEPTENVTVGEMLASAKSALGKKFEGYKGGTYKMNEYTTVNLAEYGHTGESIGTVLLDYMLGKVKVKL
jgi:hypothetical protein